MTRVGGDVARAAGLVPFFLVFLLTWGALARGDGVIVVRRVGSVGASRPPVGGHVQITEVVHDSAATTVFTNGGCSWAGYNFVRVRRDYPLSVATARF